REFGIQRRCFKRVDLRRHQSSRPKEFLAPRKYLQEVFFPHGLNTLWSAKHEHVSITSDDSLHVKYCVCLLITRKEGSHLDIPIGHLAYHSTFSGAQLDLSLAW